MYLHELLEGSELELPTVPKQPRVCHTVRPSLLLVAIVLFNSKEPRARNKVE